MPSTQTVARTGLGAVAILPWLWNWYVAANGWGPEMTPEIASAFAVIVTSILNRVTE